MNRKHEIYLTDTKELEVPPYPKGYLSIRRITMGEHSFKLLGSISSVREYTSFGKVKDNFKSYPINYQKLIEDWERTHK